MDSYKSFDFSPWGGLEGFLRATSIGSGGWNRRASYLKSVVPWLLKANTMVANYVSGLPFDIVDENGDVVDTSGDWGNVMGGMENPRKILWLLASALCGGSAYIVPEYTSKLIVNLQYIAPHTITPLIEDSGVKGFERVTDDGKRSNVSVDDLVYFWLPDSDVELGPPLSTPMSAALMASELLASMAGTMKVYSDRGFVPAYLGNAKGIPNEAEKKRTENYLTNFLKGAYDSVVKLVNSDALSLIKVGAGLEEMKSAYTEIQQAAIEDVGTAFGIPAALFMSDKAFASEVDPLLKNMYESSVFVSIYQTIEETFNSQILNRWGNRLQFRLESLSVFQDDESARASSVSQYVTAINTDPEAARFAMSFMGVDLDEEQEKQFDELINRKSEPKEEPQPITEPQPMEEQPEPLTLEETKDIALWHSKAKAWFSKGKGGAEEWENKHLREEVAAPIRRKIVEAKTLEDIDAAFSIKATVKANTDYAPLLAGIAAGIEALKYQQPAPNITVHAYPSPAPNVNVAAPDVKAEFAQPSITVNVPEQAAPVVNVNVPQQAAPIVNVSNDVQPAPVTVVKESKPPKVKISKDADGGYTMVSK